MLDCTDPFLTVVSGFHVDLQRLGGRDEPVILRPLVYGLFALSTIVQSQPLLGCVKRVTLIIDTVWFDARRLNHCYSMGGSRRFIPDRPVEEEGVVSFVFKADAGQGSQGMLQPYPPVRSSHLSPDLQSYSTTCRTWSHRTVILVTRLGLQWSAGQLECMLLATPLRKVKRRGGGAMLA